MKRLFPLLIFLIGIPQVQGQNYKTLEKVYIKGLLVKKEEVAKNCEETIERNSIIQITSTREKDGKKITITKLDTLNEDRVMEFDKKQIVEIKDFRGWANIRVDEKDKSKLYIGSWLSKERKIDSGTVVNIKNRIVDCSGNYTTETETKTWNKDTVYRYLKVKKDNSVAISSDWFSKTDLVEVLDENGSVDYYLVDKYSQTANYYIELENRSYISLPTRSVVFGPVTIPIKYRFSHEKNDVKIDSDIGTDFNAGIFVGKNWGRYRVRYQDKELKQLSNLSFTLGPFLSFGTTTMNSNSTTGAKEPLQGEKTKTIAFISPGGGAMASIYNFNIGIFGGWDLGFGGEAKKWNYNNQFWLGLGIGYDLTSGFWKK